MRKDDAVAIALDLVARCSAAFEDDVNDLLRALHEIEPFDAAVQRGAIGWKLRHAAAVVQRLGSDEVGDLPGLFGDAAYLFEHRAALEGAPARMHTLAGAILDLHEELIGALLFRLPRAVKAYRGRLS